MLLNGRKSCRRPPGVFRILNTFDMMSPQLRSEEARRKLLDKRHRVVRVIDLDRPPNKRTENPVLFRTELVNPILQLFRMRQRCIDD